MYTVDLYLRVRLACHVDGLSQREAASRFGIARETVRKMLRHSEPPGYRRRQPPKRPKLAPFTDIIDRILEEDRPVHRKQHHTAKRIFERLRDEHGFTGKETIVKDYVRERRLRRREMFVPLSHPPGHAQADFGEADAIIAGVKYRAHFFVMTLPHSDACFVAAYPAATTEAWLDGHNRAFVFFGGVPQSILYDNDKCLVSRILSDGTRQRTRAFSGLQSHYLFEDRYGRPGKGNDKGNVEGVVGYARRNFMTPLPRFASWDAFNGHLEEQCRNRQGNVLRGHRESIGERFVRDREALKRPLPAPFDACDKQGTRVNSLSLVRYRTNDYSVPVAYGHQEVWIRGYVHEVVIGCGAGIIARHPRSHDREDMVFDPIHYLPLLEHKIGALDQAAPLGARDGELDALVLADGAAEDLALAGVADRFAREPAAIADAFGGDQDALGVHAVEDAAEALAGLADQVRGRDAQVVEEDLGGGVVDHGRDGTDGHTVAEGLGQIDQEDRESVRALLHLVLGRGARQQEHKIGVLGAAGPYLLAIDDVRVAVQDRRGGEAEGIGAAGRLGDGEGLQAYASGGDLGQIAVLLRRAAVAHDGAHGVHLGVTRGAIAARGVDLLQDRRPGGQRQSAAAVGLGDEGG